MTIIDRITVYTMIILITLWLSVGMVESGDLQAELQRMTTEREIKAKMMEMGPMYYYRVLYTGELQVNKYTGDDLDKRWERLRV